MQSAVIQFAMEPVSGLLIGNFSVIIRCIFVVGLSPDLLIVNIYDDNLI